MLSSLPNDLKREIVSYLFETQTKGEGYEIDIWKEIRRLNFIKDYPEGKIITLKHHIKTLTNILLILKPVEYHDALNTTIFANITTHYQESIHYKMSDRKNEIHQLKKIYKIECRELLNAYTETQTNNQTAEILKTKKLIDNEERSLMRWKTEKKYWDKIQNYLLNDTLDKYNISRAKNSYGQITFSIKHKKSGRIVHFALYSTLNYWEITSNDKKWRQLEGDGL